VAWRWSEHAGRPVIQRTDAAPICLRYGKCVSCDAVPVGRRFAPDPIAAPTEGKCSRRRTSHGGSRTGVVSCLRCMYYQSASRATTARPDVRSRLKRRLKSVRARSVGMWRLVGDPEHLARAVASAKAALAMDLPRGAGTVPHFCLATRAIRRDDADPEQVLSSFIEAARGKQSTSVSYSRE